MAFWLIVAEVLAQPFGNYQTVVSRRIDNSGVVINGDFTVEYWMQTCKSSYFAKHLFDSKIFGISLKDNGMQSQLSVYSPKTNTYYGMQLTSTNKTVKDGAWHLVSITRKYNSSTGHYLFEVFFDGVKQSYINLHEDNLTSGKIIDFVFSTDNSAEHYKMNVDELRVYKGIVVNKPYKKLPYINSDVIAFAHLDETDSMGNTPIFMVGVKDPFMKQLGYLPTKSLRIFRPYLMKGDTLFDCKFTKGGASFWGGRVKSMYDSSNSITFSHYTLPNTTIGYQLKDKPIRVDLVVGNSCDIDSNYTFYIAPHKSSFDTLSFSDHTICWTDSLVLKYPGYKAYAGYDYFYDSKKLAEDEFMIKNDMNYSNNINRPLEINIRDQYNCRFDTTVSLLFNSEHERLFNQDIAVSSTCYQFKLQVEQTNKAVQKILWIDLRTKDTISDKMVFVKSLAPYKDLKLAAYMWVDGCKIYNKITKYLGPTYTPTMPTGVLNGFPSVHQMFKKGTVLTLYVPSTSTNVKFSCPGNTVIKKSETVYNVILLQSGTASVSYLDRGCVPVSKSVNFDVYTQLPKAGMDIKDTIYSVCDSLGISKNPYTQNHWSYYYNGVRFRYGFSFLPTYTPIGFASVADSLVGKRIRIFLETLFYTDAGMVSDTTSKFVYVAKNPDIYIDLEDKVCNKPWLAKVVKSENFNDIIKWTSAFGDYLEPDNPYVLDYESHNGQYLRLQLTTAQGCQGEFQAEAKRMPDVGVTNANDIYTCLGNSVNVDLNTKLPIKKIKWYGDGLTNANSTKVKFWPKKSSIYSAVLNNGYCEDSISFEVNVSDIQIDIQIPDTINAKDSFLINPYIIVSGAFPNYDMRLTGNLTTRGNGLTYLYLDKTGQVSVDVDDGFCNKKAVKTIYVRNACTASLAKSNLSSVYCPSDVVEYTIKSNQPDYKFKWFNGSTSNKIQVQSDSDVPVTVTVMSPNCYSEYSSMHKVSSMGSQDTVYVCEGEAIKLGNPSYNGQVEWNIEGTGLYWFNSQITVKPTENSTYLYRTLSGTCANYSDSIFVIVHPQRADTTFIQLDSIVCFGDELNLSLPDSSYVWQIGDYVQDINAFTQTIKVFKSIELTAISNNGYCNDKYAKYYLTTKLPNYVEWSATDSLCKGEVLLGGYEGINQVEWFWNDSLIANSKLKYFPKQTGVLKIQGKDVQSCNYIAKQQVDVTPYEKLKVELEGLDTLCKLSLTTLKANVQNGTNIEWSNGAKNKDQIEVSVGEYSFKVIAKEGCDGFSDTLKIHEGKIPNYTSFISDSIAICQDSLLLNLNHQGLGLVWNQNDTSNTFWVKNSGKVFVQVLGNECDALDSIYIKLKQRVVPPKLVHINDTIFGVMAYNHEWFLDNNLINGATNSYLPVSEKGIYKLVNTSKDGCKDSAQIEVLKLSLYDTEFAELELYPNPTNGKLNLKGLKTNSQVQIFDLQGKLLHSINVHNGQKNLINLDDLQISEGVFLLKVANNNGFIIKRIVYVKA